MWYLCLTCELWLDAVLGTVHGGMLYICLTWELWLDLVLVCLSCKACLNIIIVVFVFPVNQHLNLKSLSVGMFFFQI